MFSIAVLGRAMAWREAVRCRERWERRVWMKRAERTASVAQLKVVVGRSCLFRGIMNSAFGNPVALAISASLASVGARHFVAVQNTVIQIDAFRIKSPASVRQFMRRWNRGKVVRAFRFSLPMSAITERSAA